MMFVILLYKDALVSKEYALSYIKYVTFMVRYD